MRVQMLPPLISVFYKKVYPHTTPYRQVVFSTIYKEEVEAY